MTSSSILPSDEIPGMKRRVRKTEDMKFLNIRLTPEELNARADLGALLLAALQRRIADD